MLRRLSIRNYQSLGSMDLDLEGFTVVVGPSGSGKSAITRALRLLVSNARGFSYVMRGTKKTQVVAIFDDDYKVVSIERGDGIGAYELIVDGEKRRFTKLGGATPDDVSEVLQIDSDLSFAGQFDKPYLLDDSGQQVARVLGELTNVTTIFEAVREANRRRNAQGSQLRTRKADLTAAKEEVQQYRDLPRQLKACDRAEELLGQAQDLELRIDLAQKAIQTVEIAQRVLDNIKSVPKPPSLEPIEKVSDRIHRLQSFLAMAERAEDLIAEKSEQAQQLASLAMELHVELHKALVDAGVCPTCGADTRQLERTG